MASGGEESTSMVAQRISAEMEIPRLPSGMGQSGRMLRARAYIAPPMARLAEPLAVALGLLPQMHLATWGRGSPVAVRSRPRWPCRQSSR